MANQKKVPVKHSKLPVANQDNKQFHRQFGQNLHDFARERPKVPVANHEKVPVKHLNCPWQIMNSKSFTGFKMFHGKKKH